MTEVKTIEGEVLFSFDENETTLVKEIGKYKNLRYADLRGADLRGVNLENAVLIGAKFEKANLQDADLMGANLWGTNFMSANLAGAKLEGAELVWAYFKYANLQDANLCDADLWGANLEDAKNVPDIPLVCPEKGSFVAWKKVCRNYSVYLIKLEIPEDARRSSATSHKCRCDKALVLDIENLYNGKHPNKVVNYNYHKCVYEVGKMVYPDSFDEDRWNECSNGIHFFMERKDAVNY